MIIPAKSQFNWFSGFWQEDFQGFNQSEHVIGPGSHVEFPIYTKNTNLVEDHPMNMHGKFGWNLTKNIHLGVTTSTRPPLFVKV